MSIHLFVALFTLFHSNSGCERSDDSLPSTILEPQSSLPKRWLKEFVLGKPLEWPPYRAFQKMTRRSSKAAKTDGHPQIEYKYTGNRGGYVQVFTLNEGYPFGRKEILSAYISYPHHQVFWELDPEGCELIETEDGKVKTQLIGHESANPSPSRSVSRSDSQNLDDEELDVNCLEEKEEAIRPLNGLGITLKVTTHYRD